MGAVLMWGDGWCSGVMCWYSGDVGWMGGCSGVMCWYSGDVG